MAVVGIIGAMSASVPAFTLYQCRSAPVAVSDSGLLFTQYITGDITAGLSGVFTITLISVVTAQLLVSLITVNVYTPEFWIPTVFSDGLDKLDENPAGPLHE